MTQIIAKNKEAQIVRHTDSNGLIAFTLTAEGNSKQYPAVRAWSFQDGLPIIIDGVEIPDCESVNFTIKAKLAFFNARYRTSQQKSRKGAKIKLVELMALPEELPIPDLISVLWSLMHDEKRGGLVRHPRVIMDLFDITSLLLLGADTDTGMRRLFTREFRQILGVTA
jgi:hypothetical protein